ncbi:helix-turn-helix transcriptional regulator [Aquihabitans sp. McL0605]|uniref:helix-turn-helix transcriptional regulator n=1 Tax=Aquihabitans sp. McL0605 TaxID=3415671 RepID=UPI003CF13945
MPLPLPITPLIGRGAALVELAAILDRERLVTVTGAGGCGKTRLALRLASDAAAAAGRDVWFVELASVRDAQLVAGVVAAGVGVREEPDRPAGDTLAEQLRDREGLLVLDNCEQVLDGAARLVLELLSTVPGLTVLATSREPLGLAGEVGWRVPSLDDASAIELFVERASRVRPGYAPDPEQVEVVRRICQRVDGLPLGIELAAARVRMMHPERIAAGLDDRFRLLTGGDRLAMPRQQTLEASMAWSYELLDAAESATLRRLSVFAGGFTLEAAELVGADDGVDPFAVLDIVTRLVDKSLVSVDPGGARYRLLESVRVYARDRLIEAGDADAARDRHLEVFVAAVTRIEPELALADGPRWLAALEIDLDNERAALEWADATGRTDLFLRLVTGLTLFWELRGHLVEGGRWFARALAQEPTDGGDVVRARALWGAAHVALYSDDFAVAMALAPEALALAESVGDAWAKARALNTIGYAQLWTDPPAAREALDASVSLGRSLGDNWAIADGLKMITVSWMAEDDHEALAGALDALDEVAASLHNVFFAAWCHAGRGMSAVHRGDVTAARDHLHRALQACREVGDPATAGLAIAWLAELELLTGDPAAAQARLDAFIARARATGGEMGVHHAELGRATVALSVGDAAEAHRIVTARLAKPCLPVFLTWARILLGTADTALGETADAKAALAKARKGAARLGNPWLHAMVDHQLGAVARADGEYGDAEDLEHAALQQCVEAGLVPGIIEGLEAVAGLALEHESAAEAARLFSAAATLRARRSIARWPSCQSAYDRDLARTTELLGADRFAAAWSEGSELDISQAVAYATRARGERKRPSMGWASLTPTENQVVALAAEGLTNPEIAARLFIARGTVKVHLSHIFAKLGVATRTELASAATRREVERTES